METKETSLETAIPVTMLHDSEYFKYIFKKTEKMACAVFYIMRSGKLERHDDVVVTDLETSARILLDTSVSSLKSTAQNVEESALDLKFALIAFESKLRIAHAARLLNAELLGVFLNEIDSVQRFLRKYLEPVTRNPLTMSDVRQESVREKRPVRARTELLGTQGSGHSVSATRSRRDRVLDVLRDKGEATIKDIIEVITDCSEKTIQRELISLIKDNVVHREGERRWSKYKLA